MGDAGRHDRGHGPAPVPLDKAGAAVAGWPRPAADLVATKDHEVGLLSREERRLESVGRGVLRLGLAVVKVCEHQNFKGCWRT